VTTAILQPHSTSASSGIDTFSTELGRSDAGRLLVRYTVDGDIDGLLIPAKSTGSRQDGLWKHTCFEVFVKVGDSPAYYEFNLSPAGDWAVYRFDSYRAGMIEADVAQPPSIAVSQTSHRLQISAEITLPDDAGLLAGSGVAVTAVVEDRAGRISYWAAAHAPLKPDFHHDNGFVLRLPA
jgi:hypothetical protein